MSGGSVPIKRPLLINEKAVSGTVSEIVQLGGVVFQSFQVIWANGASTPVASITVAVSNGTDEEYRLGGLTFTNLTISGSPSISGNSGSHFIQLSVRAAFMRITIAYTSGNADTRVDFSGSRN